MKFRDRMYTLMLRTTDFLQLIITTTLDGKPNPVISLKFKNDSLSNITPAQM